MHSRWLRTCTMIAAGGVFLVAVGGVGRASEWLDRLELGLYYNARFERGYGVESRLALGIHGVNASLGLGYEGRTRNGRIHALTIPLALDLRPMCWFTSRWAVFINPFVRVGYVGRIFEDPDRFTTDAYGFAGGGIEFGVIPQVGLTFEYRARFSEKSYDPGHHMMLFGVSLRRFAHLPERPGGGAADAGSGENVQGVEP